MNNRDIILPIGIVIIVAMMLIPLPSQVLDILLTINIALAVTIMLVAIYTAEPLQFSTFPTILLVATLFRLGLNVSSTRLILLYGDAGEVISAFGNFVVGGNYVVGVLIFIILVIINFIVITNGATRVSEVAARFTLDAMPGKQLSIDADLNSGLITEEDAKKRRKTIEREADFYGTMDGASKFVKGDAIAGIIITIINIVGGLVVGVWQQGMAPGEAASTYTLLTVGDGLVSQLPALVISSATGIVVTRANNDDKSLSEDIGSQLFDNPRVLTLVSVLMVILSIIPGLPFIPFVVIGIVAGLAAYFKYKDIEREKIEKEEAVSLETSNKKKKAKKGPENVMDLLTVESIELEIGYRLVALLDVDKGGDLLDRITQIRRQTALDLGIVLPSVRVRDNLQLGPNSYQIKIKGIPIEAGEVIPGKWLAMDAGLAPDPSPIKGIKTVEPAFGLPALWIDSSSKEQAEALGYTVVSPSAVVATHLTEIVKKYAAEIISRADIQALIDNVKKKSEALVEDLTSDNMSIGEIQLVLQNLLRERISIRDLETILETLSIHSQVSKNPDYLTEQCRAALARSICKQNLTPEGDLAAVTLSPEVEQAILDGLSDDGLSLNVDPVTVQKIITSLSHEVENILATQGIQPVVLCSAIIRLPFRRLIERTLPQLTVMSYNEVTPSTNAKSVGVVSLGQDMALYNN
ncbi:MAG: flagellar biosynthesis protein FlhA [Cyanobacteriota bacterium]